MHVAPITHTHSDKQVGNPVSRLSFLESKLKIAYGEWALLISQEEFWCVELV